MNRKIIALCLVITLMFSAFPVTALADSTKVLTLGANLNEEEKQTVMNFFGINDLSSIEVITINNEMERALLEGKMPDAQIGHQTYSCAFIEPTSSGGINVRTANLTYVSDSTLANALMTAGVKNCNLIVTAPFPVSGTGALTGIYTAYDSIGEGLDKEKQDVAAEELVVVSDLESEYGADINDIITEVKDVVVSSDLSDDEIRTLVREKADEFNISVSDEDIERLLALLKRIQELDYDTEAFRTKVNETLNAISENSGQALGIIQRFFSSLSGFFKGIFGGKNQGGNSIFDNVNTDIFNWDKSSVN